MCQICAVRGAPLFFRPRHWRHWVLIVFTRSRHQNFQRSMDHRGHRSPVGCVGFLTSVAAWGQHHRAALVPRFRDCQVPKGAAGSDCGCITSGWQKLGLQVPLLDPVPMPIMAGESSNIFRKCLDRLTEHKSTCPLGEKNELDFGTICSPRYPLVVQGPWAFSHQPARWEKDTKINLTGLGDGFLDVSSEHPFHSVSIDICFLVG